MEMPPSIPKRGLKVLWAICSPAGTEMGHLEPSLISRLTAEGRHLLPDHLPGNPVDGRGPHRLVQPRPGHTPHTRPPSMEMPG